MIPYGRQNTSSADIQAVVDVLQSDFITQGPAVERFERIVADYCGAKYAVAVCNATAALHMACQAAGLQAGDRLWTSPVTFVASANCGLYCGAQVDFVDIDPQTCNLSVETLTRKLAEAETQEALPQVIIPVHLAGQPCEMAKIHELGQRYGFTVIEDAAHAIGGSFRGQKIGACQYSDMAVFSFHPVKIVTTGEGGMILTNRDDLYERLLLLRNHGITRNPAQMGNEPDGPWYYEQLMLGHNYRMTDIQAALGASQMQRIDAFVQRRRALASRYNRLLSDLPLTLPVQHPDSESAWHLYIIRLRLDQVRPSHREVFERLRLAGIGVNLHYIPVYRQPYYRRFGYEPARFPEAEAYYRQALSLPLFYDLTEAQQDTIAETLAQILKGA